jgi:hypothetical protein
MEEIEIRGKLKKADFKRLFVYFEKNGKIKNHYHRLSVDISSGFDETTKKWDYSSVFDLRIKKSDDKEKITLKMGSYDQKERKEIEVKLLPGEILNALDLFEAMGYKSGMIYCWESWEFDYKDFEIKFSKYSDDYYTFEIESSTLDPNLLAKELKLKPYLKNEYRKAIEWENQNIHKLYSKEEVEKLLKTLF